MVKINYLPLDVIPKSWVKIFREYEKREHKRRIEETLANEMGLTYSEFQILQNMPFCEFPKSFDLNSGNKNND